jgi:hypothetical protein
MLTCASCGQVISNDRLSFTYVVSRIHVGAGFTRIGGSTLLSGAEIGGYLASDQFPAQDWHLCSRDCLQKWAASVPPEPSLESKPR